VIHHVQIACPAGSEEVLRGYYVDVVGLAEVPKPPALAPRGGCWFAGYGIELHLGVEADFQPARKAHPGLLWPDLDASCRACADSTPRIRMATAWSSSPRPDAFG
jgi:hypothetical protein